MRLRWQLALLVICPAAFGQFPEGSCREPQGEPVTLELPDGSELLGSYHCAPGSPVVALTYKHWFGCPHQYHEELTSVATALRQLWGIEKPFVHDSKPEDFDAWRPFKWPFKELRLSTMVPMCCFGAALDEANGHPEESPCRRLTEAKAVNLLRVWRRRPLATYTAGCARDALCPTGGRAWVGGACCLGPNVAAWRVMELYNSGKEPSASSQLPNLDSGEGVSIVLALKSLGAHCALQYFPRLPEMVELADITPAGGVPRWGKVERSLHVCRRFYGYKWAEYSINATKLLLESKVPRELWSLVPAGVLALRFCAPTPFQYRFLSQLHVKPPPAPACVGNVIGRELLPLLLGYRFQALSAMLQLLPLPQGALTPLSRIPRDQKISGMSKSNTEGAIPIAMQEYEKQYDRLRTRYRYLAWKQATDAEPRPPELKKVALCVLGLARSISEPEVHMSIKRNVSEALGLGTKVWYFHLFEAEKGRFGADFLSVFDEMPPAEDCTSCFIRPRLLRIPNFTCAPPACGPQFNSMLQCMEVVEAYERTHSMRFDWVLRIRSDTRWMAPIGPLSALDPTRAHVSNHINELHSIWEERLYTHGDCQAAIPRHLADQVLGVAKEPQLCGRALWTIENTPLCRPFFEDLPNCECLLDLRLRRMEVPTAPFMTVTYNFPSSDPQYREKRWSHLKCEGCGTPFLSTAPAVAFQ